MHRVAKVSEEIVSATLEAAGDEHTIIIVLADPPMLSLRIMVSGWLRYGTWVVPGFVRAAITSPSADSDLLMAAASFSRSPVAPDFSTRSDLRSLLSGQQ